MVLPAGMSLHDRLCCLPTLIREVVAKVHSNNLKKNEFEKYKNFKHIYYILNNFGFIFRESSNI